LLWEDYAFSISEGKLSRVFGGIDAMDPELEGMLKKIIIGGDEQPAINTH